MSAMDGDSYPGMPHFAVLAEGVNERFLDLICPQGLQSRQHTKHTS